MKIGIDIDETIAQYLEGFCEFYNDYFNKNIDVNNFEDFSFSKTMNINKQEAERLREMFLKSRYFDNIRLVEGARDAISKLNKKHELLFVTARPESHKQKTEEFFKKYFPTYKFAVFHTDFRNKYKILKARGVRLWIDDSCFAKDYAGKGINVLLLDKPWNKGIEHSNIKRVGNWEEILEVVREYE
ncbi:MAG: 5' nucleotidase, NT5C type [Candidatus Nanoarchaeia archaeon]